MNVTREEIESASDDWAYRVFLRMRWPDTHGSPVCPTCGGESIYTYRTRRLYKCRHCDTQFSATTGTVFAYRKLPIKKLVASLLFIEGSKRSTRQIAQELGLNYRTAASLRHRAGLPL